MCTILTADRDSFFVNLDEMRVTIKGNQYMNDDGNALILKGWNDEELTILKTMSLSAVLALLEGDNNWERFWLHQRAATMATKTIEQCHAFSAHPWYVMHNGILHSKGAQIKDVDSRFLADVVKAEGVSSALFYLNAEETYANVFLINVDTGDFIVSRQDYGTLHTSQDGLIFSTTYMSCAPYSVPRMSEYWLALYDPKVQEKTEVVPVYRPSKKVASSETATDVVRPNHLKYYEFSYAENAFRFFTEEEAEAQYSEHQYYPDEMNDELYAACMEFNGRSAEEREAGADLAKAIEGIA